MGGKSNDFGDQAVAQGEANEAVVRNQTYANRPDQYTPWGYTSWDPSQTYDPATGESTTQWAQTTGLTPELQDILNKQIALQGGRTDLAGMLTGRMGGEFGTPMDWRGLSPMGQVPAAQFTLPEGDIESPYGTRDRAENAMWAQAMSRLGPQFTSEKNALEVKLRNQGIGPEDQAWNAQMGALDRRQSDQQNQALWDSVQQGRAESGQMYGQLMGQQQNRFQQALGANQSNWQQAMQQSNYANQIRQQQLTEAMQQRGFSLNEINALLSGQQVGMPQMPNFSQAAAAQPAPIYQGAVDQYNADQAGTQNTMNLVEGLGSAGIMAMAMSDRRLKSNIKRIGSRGGYPWYSYTMFGKQAEGVMADEVPEEYTTDIGGYKAVDYGGLFSE
jgi:hypothetical protein